MGWRMPLSRALRAWHPIEIAAGKLMRDGTPGKRRLSAARLFQKGWAPVHQHHGALGFFASTWDRVISRPVLRSLSGLQQFNVETPSRLAIALLESRADIELSAVQTARLPGDDLWPTP